MVVDARDGNSRYDRPAFEGHQAKVTVAVPNTQWTVSWQFIPDDFFRNRLFPEMRLILGHVNAAEAPPILFNAPPETLLFTGFSLIQEFSWRHELANVLAGEDTGTPFFALDLKFLERHAGVHHVVTSNEDELITHNHAWHGRIGWVRVFRVKADNTQTDLYDQADFSNLFTPRVNPPPLPF